MDIRLLEKELEGYLEKKGYDLVDVSFQMQGPSRVIRLYVEKEGGITIDDCADLSPRIVLFLKVIGIPADDYRVEVSSPGLDRVIKKTSDFIKFIGKNIRVTFRDGVQKTLIGRLTSADDSMITLSTAGQDCAIDRREIIQTRLEAEV